MTWSVQSLWDFINKIKSIMEKSKNYAPRTTVHAVRLTASHVLSKLYKYALIGVIALLAASCRSTQKLSLQSSIVQSEIAEVEHHQTVVTETIVHPVRVPMSSVQLTLRMDSLRLLPLGASYTAHQGQARLTVRRKPPANAPKAGEVSEPAEPAKVIIEANCDSLELVAMQLTKQVTVLKKHLARQQYKNEQHQKEQKDTTSFSSVQVAFKWLLIGIVIGLVLSKIKTIISFIKKRI